MPRVIGLLCFVVVLLTACQMQGASRSAPPLSASAAVSKSNLEQASAADAVYFTAIDGGEIDKGDLQRHPELSVVHSFAALKSVSVEKDAIWIDKNVTDQVDLAWLREQPQLVKTIVVVGYHDSLYAFREALPAFGIKGPYIDWSHTSISPGFSVWKWKTYTAANKSAWKRGYEQPSTIDNIVASASLLKDAQTYVAQTAPFSATQAVAAVLQDHPEYPMAGDTQAIETITGGPAPGTKVTGTLSTTVEPATEPDTYIVTLTKRWNLTVNDQALAGHWKYKVSPQGVRLVESEDNTDKVRLVR